MTEKGLIFEMSVIDFVEWLNKNRLYIAYTKAIMGKKVFE